jgi:TolB-like protein
MGTPAYMSPEQVTGRPVDHRTDIFSLGILLYQAASGVRPFEGATSIELASAVLRDTPRPLDEIRSDVPADLTRLIRRCLEKDPQRRVQTARDIANELGEIAQSAARVTSVKSAPAVARTESGEMRADEGFWIAVLPFKYTGANADVAALADGLSEEILTGLSRFSYLRVIQRGQEISARYVIDGSVRQAGPQLRVAARLVDDTTGSHVWAETYDRSFRAEDLFALQDELVPRIVSTVADANGVLCRGMTDALRLRHADQMSPYETVVRSFGINDRMGPEEHAELREALERATRRAPRVSDCWALLSLFCSAEFHSGFNPRPNPLGRALEAARRAVDLSAVSQIAHYAMAVALFFRKEMAAFHHAAQRAVELNPMDSSTTAHMGILIAYAGDWRRGLALVERAAQLNPRHPGWYWFGSFYDAYRRADYQAALAAAVKVNMPHYFYTHQALAMAYGQLGELAAAQQALRDLLALKPDFAATARDEMGKWFRPDFVEHLVDGLRKAGLSIPADPTSPAPATASQALSPASGAARTGDGFWIGVLPFKYAGTDAELAALADGLSDEILTGLARFSYLRVIQRGQEISARYVIDGSVRRAGSQLRVAARLVDVATGAHLWADTYDRAFRAEDVFALQDDLVPRIVSTVADQNGVLCRSMSDALRGRRADQLTPYEALLRSFGSNDRVTPEEHAEVREILEQAVRAAPDASDCWALLSLVYSTEFHSNFNVRPDPLGRAIEAARRAVDAAPTSQLAHYALAEALFFRKEMAAFRHAAERAVALNPMNSATTAFLGILLAYAGDWQKGSALVERAAQLNPQHPDWYWFGPFYDEYRKGAYQAALDVAARINMPHYFYTHVALAVAHARLGEREAAASAVRDLLALKPDFAATARREFGKWHQPELVEHLVDGLRKAGLEIVTEG